MDSKIPFLSDEYANLPEVVKDFALFFARNRNKPIAELIALHKQHLRNELSENDYTLVANFTMGVSKISDAYNKFKIKEAVNETMNLARFANKYFNDEQP